MAAPLNIFRSVATELTTDEEVLYTAPANTTSIVLLAQVANVDPLDNANVTFLTSVANTELVKDFTVPVGDAASVLQGKLVLEANQSIKALASANNVLKITVSILETR
jgi:hypothetical protein